MKKEDIKIFAKLGFGRELAKENAMILNRKFRESAPQLYDVELLCGIFEFLIYRNGTECKLLMRASEWGYPEVLKYLVIYTALTRNTYIHAFSKSVEKGQFGIVKCMIETDIVKISDVSKKCFRSAIVYRHIDIAKYLIDCAQSSKMREDFLYASAYRGCLEIVKYLVEKGVNIHSLDGYALKCAARKGYFFIVKYLVEKGASIYVRDHEGDSPLKNAAECGHLNVVKYLVEKGANIHAREEEALRTAVYRGHLDVAKYLVEAGADIHVRDDWILDYARRYGMHELIGYFKNRMETEES